jgi:Flp pilus assembly protein TadG
MRAKSKLSQLHQKFRKFLSAKGGNVAITFAIATLPIVGSVGFAVDYSHANSVKAALQSAVDATAMMLSKEASADTSSQLQTNALKYFTALFTRPEAQNVTITTTYTTSGGTQIVVNGSAQVPTTFLGIVGYNNITVGGSSTVKWGSSRLRVALALDNTGSMANNGKITALQTATKNLLSQLNSAAATNGDVYVSIIPVVKDVNLGVSSTATYLDWTDYGYCSNQGQGTSNSYYPYGTKSACQAAHYTWTAVSNHSGWTGCVMDRGLSSGPDTTNNYDTNVAAPSSSVPSSNWAPEYNYAYCPTAVMGLSYNWSAMNTLVNNMSPAGGTNQNIGFANRLAVAGRRRAFYGAGL